jgi:hypothetical protein
VRTMRMSKPPRLDAMPTKTGGMKVETRKKRGNETEKGNADAGAEAGVEVARVIVVAAGTTMNPKTSINLRGETVETGHRVAE